MGLEKAIEHGKEYREEYRGSKAFDPSCRNHGGCQWCMENRQYRQLKIDADTKEQIREYMQEDFE